MGTKEASILLSLLQGLRNSVAAVEAFAAAKKLATEEGRELTDAELDQFRAESDAERARLIGTQGNGNG
jgi:hypothetical protein